jgi:HlyD family secretion protein
VIALAALAGAGYVVASWLRADRAVDRSRVRIARVQRGRLVRDVVADGRVVAANNPTLYAIAPGTIEFHVRAGDRVGKGQIVGTVTSPDLMSRLAQEKATLAGLESASGRAQLDVEHGKANADKLVAQADVDRQGASRELEIEKSMFDRGVVPELELRRTEDTLKKADIAMAHARIEAGLQNKELVFDLSTKQQAFARQQEVVRELERQAAALDIASPVDGQLGTWLVAQNAAVTANAPVATVVDLGAFELELAVADSFARDIGLGMSAEIHAGSASFPGRVRSVSPEVVAGNVATRLEFVADRPAGLRQNQRLSARILIEQRDDVLEVARGPFVETGGGNSAYFVEAGVAERRPIRVGATSIDQVELLAGAQVGDDIVVSGADAFGDAERVRIAD